LFSKLTSKEDEYCQNFTAAIKFVVKSKKYRKTLEREVNDYVSSARSRIGDSPNENLLSTRNDEERFPVDARRCRDRHPGIKLTKLGPNSS
jgi:hypothetical protein